MIGSIAQEQLTVRASSPVNQQPLPTNGCRSQAHALSNLWILCINTLRVIPQAISSDTIHSLHEYHSTFSSHRSLTVRSPIYPVEEEIIRAAKRNLISDPSIVIVLPSSHRLPICFITHVNERDNCHLRTRQPAIPNNTLPLGIPEHEPTGQVTLETEEDIRSQEVTGNRIWVDMRSEPKSVVEGGVDVGSEVGNYVGWGVFYPVDWEHRIRDSAFLC